MNIKNARKENETFMTVKKFYYLKMAKTESTGQIKSALESTDQR